MCYVKLNPRSVSFICSGADDIVKTMEDLDTENVGIKLLVMRGIGITELNPETFNFQTLLEVEIIEKNFSGSWVAK